MDKVLLTAFLTALAGFITAALSIVKLVNEKESKTTDYRQSWTESARESLAELIGALNSFASSTNQSASSGRQFLKLMKGAPPEDDHAKGIRQEAIELNKKLLHESVATQKDDLKKIYHAYAKVRLHFKSDDLSFSRIEQKFDYCMGKVEEMRAAKKGGKRLKIKEQIHSATGEMSTYARQILKAEWETVKVGEPAYKQTKRFSIWACIVMLFILFTIGIHAAIEYKGRSSSSAGLIISNEQPKGRAG
ncbi:hypothetical protein SAMN05216229_102136 [Geopseudomonas sagittaria]|uniref:Four helix bundle sensory module for signal transduction n=1 Tax=Geopseudomonas sagittaria TaxID=1135990 RepID=A0A1I5Q1S0_9GAMM|nr:hypothetical protein [Pseudomonas sagittaria]SFP39826.1 hypothetical protein SAMN05216229_102136 [Pseudomonas sagittaria]